MAYLYTIQKVQTYDEAVVYLRLESQELGRKMSRTTLRKGDLEPA
jgi:hypothetical protein